MTTRRSLLAAAACSLAPARAQAQDGPPPLSITPIGEALWMHTSWSLLADGRPFPSNGLIVGGEERALLIDTTWRTGDMGPLLDGACELVDGLPLRLVCTHAHDDRMSGIEIARARGVASLAHELTQADAAGRDLPRADESWSGEVMRLDLGGRATELYYPGPAHSRDNVVVFVEDAGLLFGGCMLRPLGSGLGNTADADITHYAASVRRVMTRYGARTRLAVPGHGDHGGAELLEHTLALAEAAHEEQ